MGHMGHGSCVMGHVGHVMGQLCDGSHGSWVVCHVSRGSWVSCVMGHTGHGSQNNYDPLSALVVIAKVPGNGYSCCYEAFTTDRLNGVGIFLLN